MRICFSCPFRLRLGVRFFLEGLSANKSKETESNNRSVMPLDVLGSARATIRELVRLLSEFEKNVKS